MRMKWLHLSDIHFAFQNQNSYFLRKDFVALLKTLAEKNDFTHLLISGDLLYKYCIDSEKVKDTINFIREIIEKTNIPSTHIIIVPGNHDHNRNAGKTIVEEIYKEPDKVDEKIQQINKDNLSTLLNSYGGFFELYKEIVGQDYYVTFDNPHVVSIGSGINILKLNTSWLEKTSQETNNYLRCGSMQAIEAYDREENEFQKPNVVNIAIGHHPLDSLMETEKNCLLNLFKRANIGIYFCGHIHKARIKHYSDYDVVEFACPVGFADPGTIGGYIIGTIDTDKELYKAEVFSWRDDSWYINTSIQNVNEQGIYYFDTHRYKNKSQVVAVDLKLLNGHTQRSEIEHTIGDSNFTPLIYKNDFNRINPQWEEHKKAIQSFAKEIIRYNEENYKVHLFPMAPIPLLVALGFYLQDNFPLLVYQYDRETKAWIFDAQEENKLTIEKKEIEGKPDLVVKICTSYAIEDAQIKNILSFDEYDKLYFRASNIDLGLPLGKDKISEFVNLISSEINKVAPIHKSIHIFAAIPAGMSVELGRKLLRSLYKSIYLYNFDNGEYRFSFVIDETDFEDKPGRSEIKQLEQYDKSIFQLPILGEIACGAISEAVLDYAATSELFGAGEFYVLRARGDSMIDIGIEDGDYVIIRRQETAQNNQIAVVRIDNMTTLKRVKYDSKNKRILLHAENSTLGDQVIEGEMAENAQIQGIAVKIIKDIK